MLNKRLRGRTSSDITALWPWSCSVDACLASFAATRSTSRRMPKPCRPSPPSAASHIWSAAGAVFRGWSLAESGKLSDGIAQMRDGLAAYEATGAKAYVSDMTGTSR